VDFVAALRLARLSLRGSPDTDPELSAEGPGRCLACGGGSGQLFNWTRSDT
jgi:hypothetical protein